MKPYYSNGVVELLHGDVRQVLRGMVPESVHSAEFRLQGAGVIQCLHALKEALASGNLIRPDATPSDSNRLPPTGVHIVNCDCACPLLGLRSAQFYEQVGLSALDAKVRAQSTNSGVGSPVCRIPRMQQTSVLGRWLLHAPAATKKIVKHIDGNWNDLFDTHALREHRIARIAANPLVVSVPLDREVAIRIHNPSEVSECVSVHRSIIHRCGGVGTI